MRILFAMCFVLLIAADLSADELTKAGACQAKVVGEQHAAFIRQVIDGVEVGDVIVKRGCYCRWARESRD